MAVTKSAVPTLDNLNLPDDDHGTLLVATASHAILPLLPETG
jgi:hypothetical protein